MKNVLFCLVAFALLIFCSCTRVREEPEAFPRHLVYSGVKAKGKIRLFYNKKEITDQAEINRVLSDTSTRLGRSFKDLAVNLTFPLHKAGDTLLTFIHPDTVRLSNSLYTSVLQNRTFTFTSINRLAYNGSPGEIDPFAFGKHKPIQGPSLPILTGFTHSAYPVSIAYGDNSSMELPVMGHIFKRVTKNGSSYSGKVSSVNGVFNEFDETFVSNMQEGDTLLIQEYIYELKVR